MRGDHETGPPAGGASETEIPAGDDPGAE